MKELGGDPLKSSLKLEYSGRQGANPETGSFRLDIEQTILGRTQSESNAELSAIALASFAVLLSRLNGSEKVAIMSSVNGMVDLVPVRLHPSRHLSFKQFVTENFNF